eukprot:g20125.t1
MDDHIDGEDGDEEGDHHAHDEDGEEDGDEDDDGDYDEDEEVKLNLQRCSARRMRRMQMPRGLRAPTQGLATTASAPWVEPGEMDAPAEHPLLRREPAPHEHENRMPPWMAPGGSLRHVLGVGERHGPADFDAIFNEVSGRLQSQLRVPTPSADPPQSTKAAEAQPKTEDGATQSGDAQAAASTAEAAVSTGDSPAAATAAQPTETPTAAATPAPAESPAAAEPPAAAAETPPAEVPPEAPPAPQVPAEAEATETAPEAPTESAAAAAPAEPEED